jgi:hypothetical protein
MPENLTNNFALFVASQPMKIYADPRPVGSSNPVAFAALRNAASRLGICEVHFFGFLVNLRSASPN